MCEFVSWIKLKGKILYLNDDCLRDKKGKEMKRHGDEHFQNDVQGHGAIMWYFDLKDNKGVNEESESINTKDYPEQIVEDIKNCKMSLIGYNFRFLTDSALKDYLAIKNSAEKKYLAIKSSAYKDFSTIINPTNEDHEATGYILNSACKDYESITMPTFWELFKLKKNRIKQWQ